jgi:hypothetical protein
MKQSLAPVFDIDTVVELSTLCSRSGTDIKALEARIAIKHAAEAVRGLAPMKKLATGLEIKAQANEAFYKNELDKAMTLYLQVRAPSTPTTNTYQRAVPRLYRAAMSARNARQSD